MKSFTRVVRITLLLCLVFTIAGCSLLKTEEKTELSDESEGSKKDYELINLGDNSSVSSAKGVFISDNFITITESGEYKISGTLSDGQIVVEAPKEKVELLFDNVNIKSEDSAPLYIKEASEVEVSFTENSHNVFQNALTLVYDDPEKKEPNAVIFSNADLTLKGEDSAQLEIKAEFGDGINVDEKLEIKKISIIIDAKDDGIRGKSFVKVKEANISIIAGDDGIKSDESEEEDKGYIELEKSNIEIISGGDSLTAYTVLSIDEGVYKVISGGGSTAKADETISQKGLKADKKILIKSGNIIIDSADDALHSEDELKIKNGVIEISSGDDGIHANNEIEIDDGNIDILQSYEGIESKIITINGGNITIKSDDDGLNISGGKDTTTAGMGMGGMRGGSGFGAVLEGGELNVHGGYIYMDANGDGFDSNGNAVMTDGILIINGPIRNDNGAIDVNGTFDVSGGYILAIGSSGMAETPEETSSQYSLQVNFEETQDAGTWIHLENEKGETIFTFKPNKNFQSVVFSSEDLKQGNTYNFFTGGAFTGDELNGLSMKGTYENGELYTSLTLEDVITVYGQGNRMGGGGMMGGGRPDRQNMGDMSDQGQGMRGMPFDMELPDNWDSMTEDEQRAYMEANRPQGMDQGGMRGGGMMELPDDWESMTEEEKQVYMEENRPEGIDQGMPPQ